MFGRPPPSRARALRAPPPGRRAGGVALAVATCAWDRSDFFSFTSADFMQRAQKTGKEIMAYFNILKGQQQPTSQLNPPAQNPETRDTDRHLPTHAPAAECTSLAARSFFLSPKPLHVSSQMTITTGPAPKTSGIITAEGARRRAEGEWRPVPQRALQLSQASPSSRGSQSSN